MTLRKFSFSMRFAGLLGLALLALSPGSNAASGEATSYTVQPGDTLSGIAQHFYGDPGLWPAIARANPLLRSPSSLSVDQVLNIPARDSAGVRRAARRVGGLRVVKLSPEVGRESLAERVFAIPRDAIAPFIDRPRIFDADTAYVSPYVIGQSGGRLAAGAGDKIFVEGLFNPAISRYGIFREGQPYYDIPPGESAIYTPSYGGSPPGEVSDDVREDILGYQGYREGLSYLPYDDADREARRGNEGGQLLGYEGVMVGIAEVEKFVPGGTSSLKVVESSMEVLNGDVILPLSTQAVSLDFVPKVPDNQVLGTIIKIPLDTTQAGQFDLVYVNLGVLDGMQQGDVLDIYQIAHDSYDPRTRRNVSLPPERIGVAMVIRTFERLSFAIVLEATRAVHIADTVESWDPS